MARVLERVIGPRLRLTEAEVLCCNCNLQVYGVGLVTSVHRPPNIEL